MQTPEQAEEIIASARSLFGMFKVLFADGIFSYKERRDGQAEFSNPNVSWRAFKIIEIELSFVYDRLYTKAPVSRTKVGLLIRVGSLLLTVAGSLYALFATWNANQYKWKHKCVTYTLLAGAVLTDVVVLVARVFNIRSLLRRKWLKCCSVRLLNRRRWSGYMAQSNLITFCLQNMPSDSELAQFILRQLRPGILGYRDARRGLRGTPAVTIIAGLPAAIVEELEVSDSLQYFEQRSLFKQIRSKSFWKNFKQTKQVQVDEDLQDFIFRQLKKKESQINDTDQVRSRSPGDHRLNEEAGGTHEKRKVRDPRDRQG